MARDKAREDAEMVEAWSLERDKLQFMKEHFCAVFLDPTHGPAVLKKVAKFCRANESCWDDDPRKHAALEGRREVWLLINRYLNLSADELARLLVRPQPGE